MILAEIVLWSVAVYLVSGFVFSIPFAAFGARQIDSHAVHGTLGFRLLIVPGAVMLWPMLMWRWFADRREPPEEKNTHRSAARP